MRGLLSHNELLELVEQGCITNVTEDMVNAASIDLTLGCRFMKEIPPRWDTTINLSKGEKLPMETIDVSDKERYPLGYLLGPNEFVLGETEQLFHLPLDISFMYVLKSSQARAALNHANAGFADAGWNGSVLTLEFKNWSLRTHILEPGAKCGQILFFRHTPVPYLKSYAARGRYNNNKTVTGSLGTNAAA